MSRALALLLAAVLSALAGCAGPGSRSEAPGSPRRAARGRDAMPGVRLGMSGAEVESRLGSPLEVDRPGGDDSVQCWYYRDGIVVLDNEMVTFSFSQSPRGR